MNDKNNMELYEELLERAVQLAIPIDFDLLIRDGVLERHGNWYKVLKPDELPEHAKVKMKGAKMTKNGTLVRFRAPSKRLAKFLKSR